MRKSIILFVVLTAAYALLLISYFQSSCMWKTWCGQDMDQYIDYSNSILGGHGYSAHTVSTLYFITPQTNLYIPETMRLPAYPFLLTFFRLLYNHSSILLILNGIFISIILIYSYKLFLYFFPKAWWIPFLLILINPTIIFYTTQMASVDLFTYAMVTGFTYHIILLYKQQKNSLHLLLAFIYGVGAIFSRQNTMLFILPVSFIPLLEHTANYFKNKQLVFKNGFFLLSAGFGLLLLLWVGRNFLITKSPTISTFSDLQLFNEYTYFSLFPNNQTKDLIDWLYTNKAGEKYMSEEIAKGVAIPVAFTSFNKQIHQKTTGYMLSHPGEVLMQFGLSIKSFFLDTTFVWKDTTDILSQLKKRESLITKLLLLGFIFFPLAYKLREKKEKLQLTLWGGLLLYVLLSAFFHGTVVGNRGILPLYTIFVLLSFQSLSIIFDRVRNTTAKRHNA